ncbi:hypothetical protein ACFL2Q_17150 [Thermodesulfobacteriota bacterium]
MKRIVAVFALAAFVCSVMVISAGPAFARKEVTTYGRAIPCLLPTGKCIMQTGEACDTAGGNQLKCKTCEECKSKGLLKKN